MPIVLNSSVPLPNLKLYASISVLLVSSCLYYAINVTSDPNWKLDSNSTLFSQRNGGDSLEELLSIQDEINEKETIIENFNNLQETILAAIKATNRDEEVDVDALENEVREHQSHYHEHHSHNLHHEISSTQPPFPAIKGDRTFIARLKDIAVFMLQEPICIWVSGIFDYTNFCHHMQILC